MSVRVLAPAKVNLGLWILRRRPDGYHDIVTVFQAIDLYDEIEVSTKPTGLTLLCDRPGIPTGSDNLVIRAAMLLQAEATANATRGRLELPAGAPRGRQETAPGTIQRPGSGRHRGRPAHGAKIVLRKRIPDAAGLGGGSSDAAAALIALDRLWRLHTPLSSLSRLALAVGSDVPFFLTGGAAVGRGRGNRLTPLRADRVWHFVLVHSTEKISTEWAYSKFKNGLTRLRPPSRIAALDSGTGMSRLPVNNLYNALEPGLATRYPDIMARKQRLTALGAEAAHLTGSGSTVFGMFSSRGKAARAARRLAREGYLVDLCQSVGHGVVIEGDVGQ